MPDRDRRRVLDIGCGAGHNSRLLIERDFEVVAIDFSERALEVCGREAPGARRQCVDVRDGLPFADECFELIVADLSLHYFEWETTTAAVRRVGSCLVPGGVFAARFNSTGDVNYGADTESIVAEDPHLLAVGGIEKRFFTGACIDRLFGPEWEVRHREEKTTHRFGRPKVLWEVVALTPGTTG